MILLKQESVFFLVSRSHVRGRADVQDRSDYAGISSLELSGSRTTTLIPSFPYNSIYFHHFHIIPYNYPRFVANILDSIPKRLDRLEVLFLQRLTAGAVALA